MKIRHANAFYDLADDAISHEFSFGYACKLVTIYLHSSLPITEQVTVVFVSADGAEYDTTIDDKTLLNESNYVFAAKGDIALGEMDKIRVDVTNANLLGEIGITAKVEA